MNNLKNIFISRNMLFESGRNQFYKNLVFLSDGDKKYLELLGQWMFDGFTNVNLNDLKDIQYDSYLYKTLSKESWISTEQYKKCYFQLEPSNLNNECNIVIGTVNPIIDNNDNTYQQPIKEDNVLLYFPILYDWLKYFYPKMANEPFKTRELIKCISIPCEIYKNDKKILIKSRNIDLVEKVKTKSNV